ncbi:MAG: PDZ domain-containing protein [Lachnospiraceae bacterium]|nr:PDZ domain-containing protein [Lachnospiraceae bacterium]
MDYYNSNQDDKNNEYERGYDYGYGSAYGTGGDGLEPKRTGGWGKKILTFVLCGALFGTAAGGAFLGVNELGRQYLDNGDAASGTETTGSQANIAPTSGAKHTNATTTALDVSGVVDDVFPSVVAVTSTMVYQSYYGWGFGSEDYETEGSGSGVIIGQTDEELIILTNDHVINGASSLTITFADDTTASAAVKGTDANADLAVIAVKKSDLSEDTIKNLAVARFGSSDDMKIGQAVIAIGNALGTGQSVTVGVVSALNRRLNVEGTDMTLMQTDAAINFGNSGGGLFNTEGELIGINVAKATRNDADGMGYAIPITSAEGIIEKLSSRETRSEEVPEEQAAYIGISMQNVTSATASSFDIPVGVYLVAVSAGSPAEAAGLQEKDVITAFDGQTVSTREELQSLLKYYAAGTTVEVTVQRQIDGQYQEMNLSLTLGLRSDYQ